MQNVQTHIRSTDVDSSLLMDIAPISEAPSEAPGLEILQPGVISHNLENNLHNLDFNDICELGREAMDLRKFSNIVIGRLALEVEARYGENSIGTFSKEVGLRKSTVNQYRWVSSRFPDLKTYGDLSYTYYRIAAGTDTPEKWIEQAVENNWTVTQLQLKIEGKNLRHECKHEHRQKITIDKCVDCNTILNKEIV